MTARRDIASAQAQRTPGHPLSAGANIPKTAKHSRGIGVRSPRVLLPRKCLPFVWASAACRRDMASSQAAGPQIWMRLRFLALTS